MKKFISILVSASLLAFIYWKIGPENRTRLVEIFHNCDLFWLSISLGMVVPLTLFTSWRLQQLMPQRGQLSFGEANKLILVASVLNLVLPSKMGDIAKAYFMKERGHLKGSLAFSLVVFEKATDMLSLLWWCVFGLIWIKTSGAVALEAFHSPAWMARFGISGDSFFFWVSALIVGGSLLIGSLLIGSQGFARLFFKTLQKIAPEKIGEKFAKLQEAWEEMHGYFWQSKSKLMLVCGTSMFIWFLHLLQIWMFILALKAFAPFLANLALSPLAILAGLLPLTFAGVGTRDAALVLFYAPFFATPTAAALGLLCTARYLLPAIGGLPFAGEYFQLVGKLKRKEAATA